MRNHLYVESMVAQYGSSAIIKIVPAIYQSSAQNNVITHKIIYRNIIIFGIISPMSHYLDQNAHIPLMTFYIQKSYLLNGYT